MSRISSIAKKVSLPILVLFLSVFTHSSVSAQDIKAGETLFKANCLSCHTINKKMTGPALKDVINNKDEAWMIKWIKNSQAMVKAGDPEAVRIFKEYNNTIMTSFAHFSDDDAKNIIAYVKAEMAKPAPVAAAPTSGNVDQKESSSINTFTTVGLLVLVVVLIIVIMVLNRVIGSLERLIRVKNGEITEEEIKASEEKEKVSAFRWMLQNKKKVFFILVILFVISSVWGWEILWNTGVQKGYQPKQPIAFSHELHAGTNQINCQYCHSGAYKSKSASIPSLNVCMNCHNYVQATDKYNGEISPEIMKIYKALDYNPETRTYGENPKPIEWVRIHNLPDLAYFNHSQHVKVAGVACQKCHGPVEKMKEVYQYSKLTMGWCIDCHKNTEVNSKGNAYYDKILAAHTEIKQGKKVTAAMLGGLECVKCHY